MKVRNLKHRAIRPTFQMKRVDGILWINFYNSDAVPKFFGPTADDNRRAWAFFGAGEVQDAQPQSAG